MLYMYSFHDPPSSANTPLTSKSAGAENNFRWFKLNHPQRTDRRCRRFVNQSPNRGTSSMFINVHQCSSTFINVHQCSSMFIRLIPNDFNFQEIALSLCEQFLAVWLPFPAPLWRLRELATMPADQQLTWWTAVGPLEGKGWQKGTRFWKGA